MYIVLIHDISDPEKFQTRAIESMPLIPADVRLHYSLPNRGGSRGVCLWEADSVETVKNVIENVAGLGEFSKNEYFEVDPSRPLTIGLGQQETSER